MTNDAILVLGGTGKTGRRVVSRLQRLGVPVRAAARHGSTRFDWADKDSWVAALDGVAAVYLVDSQDAGAAADLAAFSELAVSRGVRRQVLLSARDFATPGHEELLAGEHAVQATGAQWTILRPSWFAQNFTEDVFLWDPATDTELVTSTGDGLEPFIDAWDIADVAVATLLEDGHAGQIYALSGPRLLSFGDAVTEIAAATGRDLRHCAVPDAEFAAHAAGRGLPEDAVGALTLLFRAISAGRNAHLSGGVQRVLGREPRDFADYLRDELDALRR